jgi:hypothetical protein
MERRGAREPTARPERRDDDEHQPAAGRASEVYMHGCMRVISRVI